MGKPIFEFQKFHQITKIKKLGLPITVKSLEEESKYYPDEWKTVFFKGYSRFEEVKLPKPQLKNSVSLKKVLFERRSRREFSKNPLSRKDLSTLFYYSVGVKSPDSGLISRFYPSGGGRFPLEIYFLPVNSELPKFFYHYYVKNNSLEKMFEFKKRDMQKITNIDWVKNAGGIIFITAVFNRTTIKYGERGYRHVMTEVGFVTQNFCLLASALNLAICPIGAYADDTINKFLELDPLLESVVGVLVVGKNR
ncbi:MAG TPA: SagB/ThcOx family dehydrogenase [Patescibacteria group bacterium]|nr:SagB/ThcOx family dehydrogenase [Patescibacteria group bacterium]